MSTAWAMPSRWTFQQRPMPLGPAAIIVDPFCGTSKWATHSNDLAQGGIDAEAYCHSLIQCEIVADAVLFDPPYSPRQISECYKSIGKPVTGKDTQNAALYARVRRPLEALLRHGGIALSFGWQSSGFSKERFYTSEILLVQHGGAHNDTICVAQRKREQGSEYEKD
jgi:hypothetical protein